MNNKSSITLLFTKMYCDITCTKYFDLDKLILKRYLNLHHTSKILLTLGKLVERTFRNSTFFKTFKLSHKSINRDSEPIE